MTPQEKAKELIHKSSLIGVSHSLVKECAMIAVNEIIEEFGYSDKAKNTWGHWQEVKAEIEKI